MIRGLARKNHGLVIVAADNGALRQLSPWMACNDVLIRRNFATSQSNARRNAVPTTTSPEQDSVSAGLDRVKEVSSQKTELSFTDTSSAFAAKTTFELFRGWAIFKACSFGSIVKHSEALYSISVKVFGGTIVHGVAKRTFFAHFCAGEDVPAIKPEIAKLRKLGVGAILDYAAEAEVTAASGTSSSSTVDASERSQTTARIYDYSTEEEADANMKIFELAVQAVKDTDPNGFAAVKATALGDPKLLERVSDSLNEIRSFFSRVKSLGAPLDPQKDHTVAPVEGEESMLTFEQFKAGWDHFFVDNEEEVRKVFNSLDRDGSGMIDYMEWTNRLTPEQISGYVRSCKESGPLKQSALSVEELKLLQNLRERARHVMGLARKLGVRVMIDAEWKAVQPAIDNFAVELQREFNVDNAVVFNTYQTYLKSSHREAHLDMARAKKEGWVFAAKIVRGAYMVSERARALERGVSSPIWDTYEETEANCHQVIGDVLKYMAEGKKGDNKGAELMVASHNRHTCQYVVSTMNELSMAPEDSPVYFGQLLGMADHVTLTLGQHGYKSYKYVPYGPVDKVMPYLIRRTQENSTLLGSAGVHEERALLISEIKRRTVGLRVE